MGKEPVGCPTDIGYFERFLAMSKRGEIRLLDGSYAEEEMAAGHKVYAVIMDPLLKVAAEKNYSVAVYVEGSKKPVSRFGNLTEVQAKALAKRKRDLIKTAGSRHVVRVTYRDGTEIKEVSNE